MTETRGEFIKKAAEKYKDKTAFEIKRGIRVDRFSFSQMHDLGLRFATFLERKGVKKGDKIVILAPNMPEYVLVYLGSWIAGVVVVPLDVRTKRETVEKFVRLTTPQLGFTSKYLPHPFAGFGFRTFFLEDLVDQIKSLPQAKPGEVKGKDIAEIVFTSGTTGTPKGVVLTHKNFLFDTEKVLEVFPLDKSWRILSILPLSHAFQQVVDLLAGFASGIKVIYLPRLNTLTLKRALKKHQITCMAIVPQFLSLMLKGIKSEAEEKGRRAQFELAQKIAPALPLFLKKLLFREVHQGLGGGFKFFVCGSAPLDLKLAQAWENMGIKIYEGYGATEMTAGVTINTPKVQKLGSVGKVLPGMEVKIDQDGEIWARGENISPGHFKNPEKTREVFVGGWYKSGDVGFFDKEGFLHILGRTAFKIVLPDGRKVYPEDLEKKLKSHPLVEGACVVGVKKEEGEVVHAVIITPRPKMLDQIVRETNKNLEAHQQILAASVWPNEDFPRTPVLKTDRKKVLEVVSKERFKVKSSKLKVRVEEKEAKDELVGILSEVSQVSADKISERGNLGSDLKLDSLGRVELVSLIEERLGVTVEEEKISAQTTVKNLRDLIEKGEKVEKEEVPLWPFEKLAVGVRGFLQRFLVFPLHGLFVKIEVKGRKNLAQVKPPVIFIFNHLGPHDALCLPRVLPAILRKRLVLLADSLSWGMCGGMLGSLVQLLGGGLAISYQRKVKRAGLERVGELVADGFSVAVAPEGGFSKTGELGKFKPGAGMLAVELRLPVVPIKISPNYQEIFHPTPFGRWQNYLPKKRGKVTVTIGRPLSFPKDISYFRGEGEETRFSSEARGSYIEATERMREEMEEMW